MISVKIVESWNHVFKPYREQALEYMKKVELVTKRLLEVLLKRLGVEEIDKTTEIKLMASPILSLNYYPCCPSPELTVGVGRHSDISTITILLQDETGGLYMRGTSEDSWIHVPQSLEH